MTAKQMLLLLQANRYKNELGVQTTGENKGSIVLGNSKEGSN